jgi:uncharacterized protein (TIGR00725 family)
MSSEALEANQTLDQPRRPRIALCGPSTHTCTTANYRFGEELGAAVVKAGWGIVCGGLGGFMEAVCKGGKSVPETFEGATLGLLPGTDTSAANIFVDIVVPTGLSFARNSLVVLAADIVVAVGGGVGTLSEVAYAWQYGKPIIAVSSEGGWAAELAGRTLDSRRGDKVLSANSVEEVITRIREALMA